MSSAEFIEAVYQAILIDSEMQDSEEIRKKLFVGIPELEPETIRICVWEDSLIQNVKVHNKEFWTEKLINARHIDQKV